MLTESEGVDGKKNSRSGYRVVRLLLRLQVQAAGACTRAWSCLACARQVSTRGYIVAQKQHPAGGAEASRDGKRCLLAAFGAPRRVPAPPLAREPTRAFKGALKGRWLARQPCGLPSKGHYRPLPPSACRGKPKHGQNHGMQPARWRRKPRAQQKAPVTRAATGA